AGRGDDDDGVNLLVVNQVLIVRIPLRHAKLSGDGLGGRINIRSREQAGGGHLLGPVICLRRRTPPDPGHADVHFGTIGQFSHQKCPTRRRLVGNYCYCGFVRRGSSFLSLILSVSVLFASLACSTVLLAASICDLRSLMRACSASFSF